MHNLNNNAQKSESQTVYGNNSISDKPLPASQSVDNEKSQIEEDQNNENVTNGLTKQTSHIPTSNRTKTPQITEEIPKKNAEFISSAKLILEIETLLRDHNISGIPPLRISMDTVAALKKIEGKLSIACSLDSESVMIKQNKELVETWLAASKQLPSIMLSKIPQNPMYVVYLDFQMLRNWPVLIKSINEWPTKVELTGLTEKIMIISNRLGVQPTGLINQMCLWNMPDHSQQLSFLVAMSSTWKEVKQAIEQAYILESQSDDTIMVQANLVYHFEDGIIAFGKRDNIQAIIYPEDLGSNPANNKPSLWLFLMDSFQNCPVWFIITPPYVQNVTERLHSIGIQNTDDIQSLCFSSELQTDGITLNLSLYLTEYADGQAMQKRIQVGFDRFCELKKESTDMIDQFFSSCIQKATISQDETLVKIHVRIPLEKIDGVIKKIVSSL